MGCLQALGIFFLSLGLLMLIARKSLWLGFVVAALVLGALSLPFYEMLDVIKSMTGDLSIWILSIAVGVIPLIGGVLEVGGMMDKLVKSLTIPRKLYVGLSPSALGMLPMPGGALLSAPLVDRGGDDIAPERKAAVNVWFRHVLILVYPLGTLLASAKMARVELYHAVFYTLPFFLLMTLVGYLLILRSIPGRMPGTRPATAGALLEPLGVVFLAPLLHGTLVRLVPGVMSEIHLLIAVAFSLLLGILLSKITYPAFKTMAVKVKPWRYTFLILGVFLFMYIFKATPLTSLIGNLTRSPFVLLIVIGMFLGLATGRVNLPVAIVVSIVHAQPGNEGFLPFDFALMHFAVFIGYVISPVHPCMLVSLQYFKASYGKTLRLLMVPGMLCFAVVSLVAFLRW